MGKQAAFGPFTPAVIAARSVLGEKRFNQIRGKVREDVCPLAKTERFLRAEKLNWCKEINEGRYANSLMFSQPNTMDWVVLMTFRSICYSF